MGTDDASDTGHSWQRPAGRMGVAALVAAFLLVVGAAVISYPQPDIGEQPSTAFSTMLAEQELAWASVTAYIATGNTTHRDAVLTHLNRMQQAERRYRQLSNHSLDVVNESNHRTGQQLFRILQAAGTGASDDELERLLVGTWQARMNTAEVHRNISTSLAVAAPVTAQKERSTILLVLAAVMILAALGLFLLPAGSAPSPPAMDDLYNAVSSPVIVMDRTGIITAANEAAATLFQRKQEGMAGMHFETLLPPEQTMTTILDPVLAGDTERVQLQIDDEPFELIADPVYENEHITGIRAVLRHTDD